MKDKRSNEITTLSSKVRNDRGWIPAFAGMTEGRDTLINYFDYRKKTDKI